MFDFSSSASLKTSVQVENTLTVDRFNGCDLYFYVPEIDKFFGELGFIYINNIGKIFYQTKSEQVEFAQTSARKPLSFGEVKNQPYLKQKMLEDPSLDFLSYIADLEFGFKIQIEFKPSWFNSIPLDRVKKAEKILEAIESKLRFYESRLWFNCHKLLPYDLNFQSLYVESKSTKFYQEVFNKQFFNRRMEYQKQKENSRKKKDPKSQIKFKKLNLDNIRLK